MTLNAEWTSHIPIHCQAGMVYQERLMGCLFGAMIICMCSGETSITVSIRNHKKLAQDTQRRLRLFGKESRITLMLFSGR